MTLVLKLLGNALQPFLKLPMNPQLGFRASDKEHMAGVSAFEVLREGGLRVRGFIFGALNPLSPLRPRTLSPPHPKKSKSPEIPYSGAGLLLFPIRLLDLLLLRLDLLPGARQAEGLGLGFGVSGLGFGV